MDNNWDSYRLQSANKPYYNAPKGGKSILREQQQQKDLENASTQNPSVAMIQGILSKSDLSNALSTYPFQANKADNGIKSNRIIGQPKSVKEWAMQNNELTRTQTDGQITSSLMKKAQQNSQVLEGLDS